MSNTDNSQEQYKQNVKTATDNYRNYAESFEKAETTDEKNSALDNLSYIHPNDSKLAKQVFNIVIDKSVNNNLRLKALRKLNNYLYNNTGPIKKVIKIMANKREPVNIRRAALQSLRAISFSSPALNSCMGEYKQGLRAIVRDADPELSMAAIEILAGYNNPQVQELLKEGLDDHSKAIVPDAKAIQLLGLQRTGGYNDTIRKHLEKSNNPDVLVEAITALSSDEASQNLIQQKLEDKSGDKYVRLTSLSALNSSSPDKFIESAKKIINDKSDYNDVKISSLNAIASQPRYNSFYNDQEFSGNVESLTTHENEALRNESNRYITNRSQFLKSS